MLTPHKALIRGGTDFVAKIFLSLGFSPNGITILGLVLGILNCFYFMKHQNPALFAFLVLFFGLFDLIDGAAARITNRVTKFGSYLDAICDRIYDTAAGFAAAYVSGYWGLFLLLVSGASLISYAKARAAMEIPIENTEWPDFMERMERSLVFVAGLFIWGFFPNVRVGGHDLFFWIILGLNIAVYATVIQRMLRAKRFIQVRS